MYNFESVKRFGDIVQNYLILLVWQEMMKRKLISWCVMKIDGDLYTIILPHEYLLSFVYLYLLQIKFFFQTLRSILNILGNSNYQS